MLNSILIWLLLAPESAMSHASTPLVPLHQREIITSLNNIPSVPAPKPGMPLLLGPNNTECECPFCYAGIKTSVQYTSTARTHIAAATYCTVCCLCCIPFCSDSAKNVDHYCPRCNRYLGTYRR